MTFSTKWVNPIQLRDAFHIETGHLFCSAKRMPGFYMNCNTGQNWVKGERLFHEVEVQPVPNQLTQLFLVTLCCDTY